MIHKDVVVREKIIADILDYPYAPKILEEANKILQEERKRRASFYNEITEFEKAEFINGEIIIHSPVKKAHNDASSLLFNVLNNYVLKHQSGFVGYEKIMVSLTRNDYEPDICFFHSEKSKTFTSDQSLFPAPDLVVEVLSERTSKNDREIKFFDYQAHGVGEYWLVEPFKKEIEQYRLQNGKYELVLKSSEGHVKSEVVENFTIDIKAIFDQQRNLEELAGIIAE